MSNSLKSVQNHKILDLRYFRSTIDMVFLLFSILHSYVCMIADTTVLGFFCVHMRQIHNFSCIKKLWNQSNIAILTLNYCKQK